MARTTLSARGERVDFDLIEIKEQIARSQMTVEVNTVSDFIDQKFDIETAIAKESPDSPLAAAAALVKPKKE